MRRTGARARPFEFKMRQTLTLTSFKHHRRSAASNGRRLGAKCPRSSSDCGVCRRRRARSAMRPLTRSQS